MTKLTPEILREVNGSIVEAGDIPVVDGEAIHTYRRAIVIQFETDEDIRSALELGTLIRANF